jgi:hypothetical protein
MAEFVSPNELMYKSFEPKRQNQWIMYIEGIPSYLVHVAGRPKISFGEVEVHHINVKRKLKGKPDYDNLSLTLYDPIAPSGTQAVMEWIRLSHEAETGRDGYSDFYKKDLTFNTLSPVGEKAEEWAIKGAWVQNSDFGDGDWSSEDLFGIELTIAYDYPSLNY